MHQRTECNEKINVFVAATETEWLPAKVLEFSIRSSTQNPVDVHFLYASNIKVPVPKKLINQPRTPFSFQRFLIPELCHYSGKAIYLDADMQVFKNIKTLWDSPLENCSIQTISNKKSDRPNQYSVMLMDCSKLTWEIRSIINDLDEGKFTYEMLMYNMCLVNDICYEIPDDWNSLEYYKKDKTCLLHYTDMNTQPWVSNKNPLGNIWLGCLEKAIENGAITIEEIANEIARGHVRPSLMNQLGNGKYALNDYRENIDQKLDRFFIAPYKKLHLSKRHKIVTKLGRLIKNFKSKMGEGN